MNEQSDKIVLNIFVPTNFILNINHIEYNFLFVCLPTQDAVLNIFKATTDIAKCCVISNKQERQ